MTSESAIAVERHGSGTAVKDATHTLIDDLLREQQCLTAVDRFARHHEHRTLPARTKLYSHLLPATPPGEGQQYAFSVDLDACSGCKACVTACHSLNGLDDEEIWRSVGLLHGGDAEAPFQQTITTACHHCVDPACLNGCPVLAYEKDPRTGIVRHLDDQCIGCQYCVLKCPYDVPKYSAKRGIVRKCDMCSGRLAVGEAPACAQACPNEAITITLASTTEAVAKARAGDFLPGTPDPRYTVPTTSYTTTRALPANVAPADEHALKPAPSHPPLVFMLVVTQLSVGAFCVETFLRSFFPANLMTRLSPLHACVALALGLLAPSASTLHLGRPLYAWRAILGLAKSWLSREIVAFGLFAGLATLAAAGGFLPLPVFFGSVTLSLGVSLTGLCGVFCSFMLYRDTRRDFWRGASAFLKFFGTTAVLGIAVLLFVTTLQALLSPSIAANGAYCELTSFLSSALLLATLAKLGVEIDVFRHRRSRTQSSLRRTARLLTGELAEITTARFILGFIGGALLPLALLLQPRAPGFATLGVTLWILLFAILGELLERYLFFTAVAPPAMPGGINS